MNQLPETAKNLARQAADGLKATAEKASDAAHDVTEAVEDGAECAKGYAQHALDATRDAAQRATEKAREIYQSAALKAEDTMVHSKDFVRRNPVPVVLGAIAMIMCSRRKPAFSEQYVSEPLGAVRDAILTALAPVTQRVHEGYDSARDGVGKAMNRMHRCKSGHSVSDRIGRVGSNLKFW